MSDLARAKAANFLVTLSKRDIKSVTLGKELNDKYTFQQNKGQRICTKCLV